MDNLIDALTKTGSYQLQTSTVQALQSNPYREEYFFGDILLIILMIWMALNLIGVQIGISSKENEEVSRDAQSSALSSAREAQRMRDSYNRQVDDARSNRYGKRIRGL